MIKFQNIELPHFGKITIFNEKLKKSKIAHVFSSTMMNDEYTQKIFKIIKWYKKKYNLPWDIIVLNDGLDKNKILELINETNCTVVAFEEHLGRKGITDYPYEWRNLYYIKNILKDYDKVIFMANDFYVMSKKFISFLNFFNEGWSAFWTTQFAMPESACQIINKNCNEYNDFVKSENFLERSKNIQYEEQAKFTHVIKNFKGCRYGEYLSPEEFPQDADYIAQVKLETNL